jgi:hypothetical protein
MLSLIVLESKIYKMSPVILRQYDWFFTDLNKLNVTIDKMTTQGRFKAETIACDRVDFPDPELPAMPMIVTSAQGGE